MEVKYETVKQTLRNEIIGGEYKINEKLSTKSALMEHFNVSRYTIRRTVRDLEDEHYIYHIQDGGIFVQDQQRDQTKGEKNKIIEVISTHMASHIFPPIIPGIDSAVTEQGYSMVVGNTPNDHKRERRTILNMLDLQIAGLIIEPAEGTMPSPNLDFYRQVQKCKIPTVLFYPTYSGFDFPSLPTKDREAEENLTKYLFGLGHTNILGVFQIDDQQGVDRMTGMTKACQDNNIPTIKLNVIIYQSSKDYEDIIKKVDMILNSNSDITAIAYYNDHLAIKVISHLQKHGKQVPTDISIIGFDNYGVAQVISPSLTIANHPKHQLGGDAGKMILKMTTGGEVTSKVYTPTVIKGQSATSLITKKNINE